MTTATATPEPITIPAAVVQHVHDAALYKLGLAADEIGNRTDLAMPALEGPLQRFDSLRAIVEMTRVEGRKVEITTERDSLLDALSSWAKVTAAVVHTAAEEGHYALAGKDAHELALVTDFMAILGEPAPA
jgi:hypothetical protein